MKKITEIGNFCPLRSKFREQTHISIDFRITNADITITLKGSYSTPSANILLHQRLITH